MPYAAYCGSAHLALGFRQDGNGGIGVFPGADTIRDMPNWTMQVLLSIDVAAADSQIPRSPHRTWQVQSVDSGLVGGIPQRELPGTDEPSSSSSFWMA